LSKPRHIQKPNGQLAGSIGAGKDAVPTEVTRPDAATVFTDVVRDDVTSAWENFRRIAGAPAAQPDTLEEIDSLSAQVVDTIMRLRDDELTARSSLTSEGQDRADALAEQAALLHASVLRAREDLRRVRESLDSAGTSMDIPGVRAIIDADLLAYEVTQVASTLQERCQDVTAADAERANKSIATAATLLRRALERNS
jgi:hypothetical protein